MQKWWKNPKLIGVTAYYVMSVLKKSLRIKIVKNPEMEPDQAYLVAFWHGKQFMPSVCSIPGHKTPIGVLVSPSRDGAMLAVFLERMGYEIVKGSSRDSGTRALLQIKQRVEQGSCMGFAVDGPIGPIHEIKPGIVFLAQKSGLKIVTVGSAFSRYWIFSKAWDKFQLPKPFAKAVLVYDKPVTIDPNADVDAECRRLEKILQQSEQRALELLNK